MTLPPHLGESKAITRLELRWHNIKSKIPIYIELINFSKSKPRDYKEGAYHDFVAYCPELISAINLDKGDYFIISIPYKTFERALYPLSFTTKKMINNCYHSNDNLLITFVKDNHQRMVIRNIERKVEDPEMSKKADELLYGTEKEEEDEEKDRDTEPIEESGV